jgi:hypothetical protein
LIPEKNLWTKGAHTNFVTIEDKLRFEVHIKAVNKARIKLGPSLLATCNYSTVIIRK